jgi:hypothetical protein
MESSNSIGVRSESISHDSKHQINNHEKSGGESSGILSSIPGYVRYAADRIKMEGVGTIRIGTSLRYLQKTKDNPRLTGFLPQRVFPVYSILAFPP